MNIITKILNTKELLENPPVLVDVGASGEIDRNWKHISKYSICITFDADNRETKYIEKENKNYRKLFVFPCILTSEKEKNLPFYLTKSPYCSSTLKPLIESLENYEYYDLFKVVKTTKIKSTNIPEILKQLKVKQIDWFKTDSQGTDLRLFKSMGSKLYKNVLAVEFEPGIIDAYKGEDKLWHILSFMDSQPFWMSALRLAGAKRINSKTLNKVIESGNVWFRNGIPVSPGWTEITYLNSFKEKNKSKRDYLLMWVFATINKQYGQALELVIEGKKRFKDTIFKEMEYDTLKKAKRLYIKNTIGYYINLVLNKIKIR